MQKWTLLIWVVIIIWYAIYGWVSIKSNEVKTNGWMLANILVGICPLWAIIARYSKNIMWDGIIYDVLVFSAFYAALLYFGHEMNFGPKQLLGLGLIGAGMLIYKLG